jgi:hypothetical protein
MSMDVISVARRYREEAATDRKSAAKFSSLIVVDDSEGLAVRPAVMGARRQALWSETARAPFGFFPKVSWDSDWSTAGENCVEEDAR